jgi:pre-rRNA-processing protein TSR4
MKQDWLDAENRPSAALARCKVCKDMMALLLQLNGELPEKFPGHERRLYVFGCRRLTCRRKEGSVRAVRGIRVWKEEVEAAAAKAKAQAAAEKEEAKAKEAEAAKQQSKAGPGLGDALFGATGFGGGSSGANPFSSGGSSGVANPFASGGSGASNPFGATSSATKPVEKAAEEDKTESSQLTKSFAETLSINAPPTDPPPPSEPWPEESAQPAPYPTLYLADADYETLEPTSTKLPSNARIESEDAAEPSILDKEAFESTMDAAFQKFADRLSQNPEQVIRYEFGGTPLLYSKTDAVGKKLSASGANGIPRCGSCGGGRVFEVQMTPHAIAELEEGDLSLEGMEWGTIIVGVCERDCTPRSTESGEAGYLEEWAGVQWEELVSRK